MSVKLIGMAKLKKDMRTLGGVPQKHVTAAARKGMNIPLADAKKDAPTDSGLMRRALILVGERSRLKGKKVYRIIFADFADFKGQIEKPGTRGGKGRKDYFYPQSQEYGYFTGKGKFKAGEMFAHRALKNNASAIEKTIIGTMQKKIEAEIAKAGLK